jgi:hypothetical protein
MQRRNVATRAAPFVLGLACLSAACLNGPHRLLIVSTPDRQHRVAIVEIDGMAALDIDGRRAEAFAAIVANSLTFDARGRHVAYAVADGDRHRLALDHCAGEAYDGIGEIVFSPDGERLAYAAALASRWHVVVDGQRGPALRSVFAHTLRFDRDGAHVAYVAEVEGGARVFVDQTSGPLLDAVSDLQLPRQGAVGYVARRGLDSLVMRGEQPIGMHPRVGALWVGEDGHTAYAARHAQGWVMVYDGSVLSPATAPPELAGSDDGQHAAWLASGAAGVRVWLDRAPFAGPFARVRPRSLRFAPGHGAPSFVAQNADGRSRAILAGAEQPELDAMGELVFSADGRHSAYAGRRDGEPVLVRDGVLQVLREPIGDPVLSPAGDRVAFVPLAPPARVVVNGREHVFSLLLPDTLAFSRDGRHWAALAGNGAERQLYFAVDGSPGPSFDFAELISRIGGAEADGSRVPDSLLRDWARATADAASTPAATAATPRWLSGRCERGSVAR